MNYVTKFAMVFCLLAQALISHGQTFGQVEVSTSSFFPGFEALVNTPTNETVVWSLNGSTNIPGADGAIQATVTRDITPNYTLWIISGSMDQEGTNILIATATDEFGDSTSTNLPIYLAPPSISAIQATNSPFSPFFSASVIVSRFDQVVWSLNGSTNIAGSNPGTQATVSYLYNSNYLYVTIMGSLGQDGTNILTATAIDELSNSISTSLPIYLAPPSISAIQAAITLPAFFTASVIVPFDEQVVWSINGSTNILGLNPGTQATVSQQFSTNGILWTISGSLVQDGTNLLTATATDEFGNSISTNLPLNLAPPSISAILATTSPSSPLFSASVTVPPNEYVVWSLNGSTHIQGQSPGNQATISSQFNSNSFVVTITGYLNQDGTNILTATAIDEFTNSISTNLSIYLAPPSISAITATISPPLPSFSASVVIPLNEYVVWSLNGTTITPNAYPGQNPGNPFTLSYQILSNSAVATLTGYLTQDGTNILTATAIDEFTNSISTNLSIYLAPPSISAITAATSLLTNFTASVTVPPNEYVVWSLNGSTNIPGQSPRFPATVSYQFGSNILVTITGSLSRYGTNLLTATATDEFTNSVSTNLPIYLAPPIISAITVTKAYSALFTASVIVPNKESVVWLINGSTNIPGWTPGTQATVTNTAHGSTNILSTIMGSLAQYGTNVLTATATGNLIGSTSTNVTLNMGPPTIPSFQVVTGFQPQWFTATVVVPANEAVILYVNGSTNIPGQLPGTPISITNTPYQTNSTIWTFAGSLTQYDTNVITATAIDEVNGSISTNQLIYLAPPSISAIQFGSPPPDGAVGVAPVSVAYPDYPPVPTTPQNITAWVSAPANETVVWSLNGSTNLPEAIYESYTELGTNLVIWTMNYSLTQYGTNTFVATATDEFNNSVGTNAQVYLAPPSLSAIQTNYISGNPPQYFTATIIAPANETIVWLLDGSTNIVGQEGQSEASYDAESYGTNEVIWTVTGSLTQAGTNILTAVATDEFNNSVSTNKQIYLTPLNLSGIVIYSLPGDPAQYFNGIVMTPTNETITWSLNGSTNIPGQYGLTTALYFKLNFGTNTIWTINGSLATDGTNILTATATAGLNLPASTNVQIYLAPPGISPIQIVKTAGAAPQVLKATVTTPTNDTVAWTLNGSSNFGGQTSETVNYSNNVAVSETWTLNGTLPHAGTNLLVATSTGILGDTISTNASVVLVIDTPQIIWSGNNAKDPIVITNLTALVNPGLDDRVSHTVYIQNGRTINALTVTTNLVSLNGAALNLLSAVTNHVTAWTSLAIGLNSATNQWDIQIGTISKSKPNIVALVAGPPAVAAPPSTGTVSLPFLTSTGFGFTISGTSTTPVVIEASVDLQTWTPIQTNATGNGVILDPQATNYPTRFYQVIPLQ